MKLGSGWVGAVAFGLSLVLVGVAADAQQRQPPQNVRGQIVAVDGDMLKVKTREGAETAIKLGDKTGVSTLTRKSLDDIKAGTYIGTAAVPQRDGRLVAQEVLIFPDAMRGTGEGHRPWDLTPESTMTNATVEAMVTETGARTLKLKYKDGEKVLVVPPEAPIVTLAPGDRSLLKPGARVFIFATKGDDGSLTAARVTVEKDGVVPPM